MGNNKDADTPDLIDDAVITDAELAGLSPEEIEALDTNDDDGQGEVGDGAAAADSDSGDQGGEGPDDAPAADTPAADDSAQKPVEDAAPVEDTQPQTAEAERGSVTQDQLDRAKAIEEEIDGLGQKVEDGEISFSEYHKENTRLMREKQGIDMAVAQQRMEDDAYRKSDKRDWDAAQAKFFADPVNKQMMSSRPAFAAIDAEVRALAATGKYGRGQYDALLKDARDNVRKAFGMPADVPASPAKPDERPRSGGERIPGNLSNAPAAKPNDADEFSYLDKLDGMQLEAAIASMPRDVAARYEQYAEA